MWTGNSQFAAREKVEADSAREREKKVLPAALLLWAPGHFRGPRVPRDTQASLHCSVMPSGFPVAATQESWNSHRPCHSAGQVGGEGWVIKGVTLEWDLDEGIDVCWAESWGRGGFQAVAQHTQTQGVSELNIFPEELCVGLYKGCYDRKTKRTYYRALQDRYTIGNANSYDNC